MAPADVPPDLLVGVNFLVVPDGFDPDRPTMARFSISITPRLVREAWMPAVDLRHWPKQIYELTCRLRLAIGHVARTRQPEPTAFTVTNPRYVQRVLRPDIIPGPDAEKFAEMADTLWRRIFMSPDPHEDTAFRALRAALEQAEKDGVPTRPASTKDWRYGSYSVAGLSQAIDALYTALTGTAVFARLRATRGRRGSGGGLRQPEAPGIPAWKRLQFDWLGAGQADDPVSLLAAPRGRRGARLQPCENDDVVCEMQALARRLAGEPATDDQQPTPMALEGATAEAMAAVARFFLDRTTDEQFWRTGVQSSPQPAAQTLAALQHELRREVARFSECWNLDWYAVPRTEEEQDKEDAAEAPKRKYGAIQSYPTLAKFLGFIVDVEVPVDVLIARSGSVRTYGAAMIDPAPETDPGTWGDAPLPGRLWTTFVHRPAASVPAYFGPCLKSEAADGQPTTTHAFKEGLLDLAVTMSTNGGTKNRFVLQTMDTTNGLRSLMQEAREIAYRNASGLPAARISTTLPPIPTRGIELIDAQLQSQAIAQADRERAARSIQPRDGLPLVNDVENLVLGYRIDAGLATKQGANWRDVARWRPLFARSIQYRARKSDGTYEYRDIPRTYLGLAGVTAHVARDDGHTRMMQGDTDVQDEAPDTPIEPPPPDDPDEGPNLKHQTVAHGQVFTWTGQSLGVSSPSERPPNAPANAADCRTVWPCPETDLAIDLEIDLPRPPERDGVDRRPPPLREGRSYMFGARLCLVNGCGVTFEDARARYVDPAVAVVLGRSGTEPFPFLRREHVEPPDVLLPWNDRLVRAPLAESPGERVDVLVVRSGDVKETGEASRLLVPARVTFDLAEQGGVFDPSTENRPQGAFAGGAYRASLDPKTGTFPVARHGRWEFPALPDTGASRRASADPTPEPSRGSVFVLASSGRRPETEFYPDPLGRSAMASFCRVNGELVDNVIGFGPQSRDVAFWEPAKPSREAGPILLELKRPSAGQLTALRGYFDEHDQHEIVFRHPLPLPVRVRKLAVVLNPAETVDLEISAVPDTRELLARHEIFRSLAPTLAKGFAVMKDTWLGAGIPRADLDELDQSIAKLSGPEAEKVFDEILRIAPLDTVHHRRYVRLVHAVQRPMEPPQLLAGQFHPVVITVAPENQDPNPELQSWTQYVANQLVIQPNPLKWDSEPGGTVTFFVGAIKVHRLSTGSVRCEARWREFGPESERYDPQAGVWDDRAPYQYARLFEISDIALSEADPSQAIDLLRDDAATALRGLSFPFRDGRARRLSLVLLATSRFTAFYPPAPSAAGPQPDQVGLYESASSSFDATRAVVWVPATARPAPPDVDKVVPVFRWSVSGRRGAKEIRFRRDTTLRVHLKRPWHSSGEDEMLAVVCWPPNLVNDNPAEQAQAADEATRATICELESAMGALSRFVTRWGADPIRLSGQLEHLISADRFSDFDAKAANLLLTMATDPVDAPQRRRRLRADDEGTKRVSVLGYRPKLDREEGVWTCDVTVDHGAAYFPFIQLGLARYQPHALSGLELSTPVAHIGQIPPRREGRVVFSSDRELVLELHGVGYHRSETGGHETERHNTDVPLLNVRLLRATDEDDIPRHHDHTIRWQRVLDSTGTPIEQLRLRPLRKGPELWWVTKVTLPNRRRDNHYGLLIEEVELMPSDRMSNPAPSNCTDITFYTELEERGPLFSHVVDLCP